MCESVIKCVFIFFAHQPTSSRNIRENCYPALKGIKKGEDEKKIPEVFSHQQKQRQMKPIESDLMEPENPRVYRLVLTGGEALLRGFSPLCVCVDFVKGEKKRKGKSRGFSFSLTHFIFRHHPVCVALFLEMLRREQISVPCAFTTENNSPSRTWCGLSRSNCCANFIISRFPSKSKSFPIPIR